MKISKLRKFAGVLLALAIGTTSLFAQDQRGTNETFVQNSQIYTCLDVLSGLTQDQVSAITALEEKHQERMAELRNERRSTPNFEEKDLIREEMLENVVNHRSAVKKLLTEEQQKEYDLLQLRGNNFRNQRVAGYGRNGNFRGQGQQGNWRGYRGNGYGRGYQQGNYRQNYRNCPAYNNRNYGGQGGY